CHVVADYCSRADGRFIAYLDAFPDHRAWADGYVLSDFSGRGNDGGRMDRAMAVGIAEQPRGSRKGETRLRGNQNGLGGAGAAKLSGDYGGGGRAERGV